MADKLMVNIFKMEGTVMQTLKYRLEYLGMKPVLTHTKNTTTTTRGRRGLLKEGAYDKLNALAKGLNREGLNEEGLNREGLNREGLNKEGLNEEGLTSLHPNISMHILHTILNIFLKAMTRGI